MSDPAAKPLGQAEDNPALARVIWGDERQGLRQLWDRERALVEPAVGSAAALLMLGLLLTAAHVARIGVLSARALALVLLCGAGVLWVLRAYWLKRARRDARLAIVRTVGASDPTLAERTVRALGLLRRVDADPSFGSAELAQRHFERLVGRTSLVAVEVRARQIAGRYRRFFWPALALCLILALGVNLQGGSILVEPARVLEGYNVLLARSGKAPFAMQWLTRGSGPDAVTAQVSVIPPRYLREAGETLAFGERSRLARGSEITVRGSAVRPGRALVLTDGQREVEFVDDGTGAVVAHYSLEQSATLFVAARFGEVRIFEPLSLVVEAALDTVPSVELEGAPATVKLEEIERLELRYRAFDDHGLRQLDLVLRSGGKEQRRPLARLDGQTKLEQGGYALGQNDSFLQRLFLPVVISVEAKDNEPLSADRWGKSSAITLIPPALGTVQTARLDVLLKARDALTEFLAWQLHAKDVEATAQISAKARVDTLASEIQASFQGKATLNPGVQAFITAQVVGLSKLSGEELAAGTESALLAVDMLARRLAVEDARFVAKQLADVAKEIAGAARQAQLPEGSGGSAERFDAAAKVLEEGGKKLSLLLELGHDLGTLTLSELDRIRRARDKQDFFHAELAARHLALRLSRPNPSFGSAASGGSEAGQGNQSSASSETSDADQKFDQWASELERLAQEHAKEISTVERALKDADSEQDLEPFRQEASAHASAIRQLMKDLPDVGAPPETAEGALALAREYAAAMAQNLERLAFEHAVESGRDSVSSLKDSARKRSAEDYNTLPTPEALKDKESQLKEHLAWAERIQKILQERASVQAKGQLENSANRERELGTWAEQMTKRGQAKGAAVSQQSLEGLGKAGQLMRQAEAALAEGRGENGRDFQLEAQRYLEQASTGTTQTDNEGSPGGSVGKASPSEDEVPKAERRRKAEEFRKRVLEGLGQASSGKLAPAVKRYAEGLLQ